MEVERFRESPIGKVVPITGNDPRFGEAYDHWAYVPDPLPGSVTLAPASVELAIDAALALGRLDQAGRQLPNPALLRRPTLRREAQSTSALEGTYAALSDVLGADIEGAGPRTPELVEVLNYVAAAEYGYDWVREGRQVTYGLMCDLHALLMKSTRGEGPESGRVRQLQVVIGTGGRISEARFVPPPPGPLLETGVRDLLERINRGAQRVGSVIIDSALAHYQFETLHPFNDGNGRIGRLLVMLQLLRNGVLAEPLFTVSPWFEARRTRYQDELQVLSMTGDWDRWVAFFCEGICAQAASSTVKIRQLLEFQEGARTVARASGRHSLAVDIASDLIGRPVLTVSASAARYGVSFVAANKAIARLVERGLLNEITGRGHDRVFRSDEVLRILER